MTRSVGVENCFEELQKEPIPWEVFMRSAPEAPGIYALWLMERAALGSSVLREWNESGPIYVGETANLSIRQVKTHFASDGTGWSTVRRSVGSLLKAELQLVALPRGNSCTHQNFTSYKFEPDGEQRLTSWMQSRLYLTYWADEGRSVSENERVMLESRAIRHFEPPLSINKWDNPYRKALKAKRHVCALEAEGNYS